MLPDEPSLLSTTDGPGVAHVDLDGRWLRVNEQFCRLIGYDCDELLAKPLRELIHPHDLAPHIALHQQLSAGQIADYCSEKRYLRADGEIVKVFESVALAPGDAGNPAYCVVVAEEMSAFDQVREESDRMLKRQKLILQFLPVGAGLTDTEGVLLDVNPAICRLLGYTRHDLIGSSIFGLTIRKARKRCETAWEKMGRKERKGYRTRTKYLKQAGDYIDGELFVKPIYDADDQFDSAVVVIVDLGPQLRAERAERETEAAQLLTSGLIRGQEAERRRLARDLHDDFSQRLAVMAMRVSSVAAAAQKGGAERSECDTILAEIAEMNEALRLTAHQLHPASLERLGLQSALAAHCKELQTASGENLQVTFSTADLQDEVHSDVALCLYRVAQESLHNVVKYAQAKTLQVRLEHPSADELSLSITDDGVGFDVDKTNFTDSLGMVSMRERLRLVGGELTVDSKPGGGTTVTARSPRNPSALSADAPNRPIAV